MDISHYFTPVDSSVFQFGKETGKTSEMNLQLNQESVKIISSELDNCDAAIIGAPFDNGKLNGGAAEAPDIIRKHFYRLHPPPGNSRIRDLGNLKPGKNKKANLLALRDVVGYLTEKDITAVIIGGSQELTAGICDAFNNEKFFTLSVADSVLNVKKGVEKFDSTNFLTRIFKNNPNLFQFSLLSYQTHLFGNELFEKTNGVACHCRLGKIRQDITQIEPILRNSDIFSFDMGAVKFVEAPGSNQKNPNGLRSEEACQLAKYAGTSNKLKVFGIFELFPDNDSNEITSKLASEMIWYFFEGYNQRKTEVKSYEENRTVYRVEIDQLEKPLVFYHDSQTEKWWFEIQPLTGKKLILACSEKDYLTASANEIPDMWLNYIQKMDVLSK